MSSELMRLDPRIRRTRTMLFEAFEKLLSEKSFESISVQDIAERSTVNRATFYDHFADKLALIEALMGEKFCVLLTARMKGSDGTCETGLRQLILAVCDFLGEVSLSCQNNQRQFEPMVESKVKAVVREFLIKGLCNLQAKDPELKATMVSWAITGAVMQWSREKKTSPEKLAEAILPTVKMALKAESCS